MAPRKLMNAADFAEEGSSGQQQLKKKVKVFQKRTRRGRLFTSTSCRDSKIGTAYSTDRMMSWNDDEEVPLATMRSDQNEENYDYYCGEESI